MAISSTSPAGTDGKTTKQRRASVRYHCGPATMSRLYVGDRQEFQRAWVLDISVNGIGLLLSRPVEIGLLVVIHLKSNDGTKTYTLAGQVVRVDTHPLGDWVIGCELTEPLTADELDMLL